MQLPLLTVANCTTALSGYTTVLLSQSKVFTVRRVQQGLPVSACEWFDGGMRPAGGEACGWLGWSGRWCRVAGVSFAYL